MSSTDEVTRWLLTGERGLSSEAMMRHLADVEFRSNSHGYYPIDLDDLRRCEVALRECPSIRGRFPGMASVSRPWKALVEVWDEIVRLVEEVDPDYFQRRWMYGGHRAGDYTQPRDLLRKAIGRAA